MDTVSVDNDRLELITDETSKLACFYFCGVMKRFCRHPIQEISIPSQINGLKSVKEFIQKYTNTAGVVFQTDENGNLILKKSGAITINHYKLLELQASSVLKLQALNQSNDSSIYSDTSFHPFKDILSNDISNHPSLGNKYQDAAGLLTPVSSHILTALGQNPSLLRHRRRLPIYQYREQILKQLEHQRVVIIMGETSCGKTTQVPQYILEYAFETKTPCRIVSVQPRNISAVLSAERVASERGVTGEKLVSCQTRLASHCCKEDGLLTFCSMEILLRSLIDSPDILNEISHLIIDQLYERDRFTDILLAVMRLHLFKYPHLHLILLTSDQTIIPGLTSFFNKESVISIQPTPHRSQEYFLEDILSSAKSEPRQNLAKANSLIDLKNECDELIAKAFFNGSDAVLFELMKLVRNGSIPIDYQHSRTGMTILMAAAIHGKIEIIKSAIGLGADPTIKVKGVAIYDMANEFAYPEAADLLMSFAESFDETVGKRIYQYANPDLIIEILNSICADDPLKKKTVLIFLSCFSEIVDLNDMLLTLPLHEKLELHMLHRNTLAADHKKMLLPTPDGKTKVILTTSIAETSIHFNDIDFVIDCGRIRDKENEVVVTNNRTTNWITKTSVLLRKKRVVNGGVVYRLYSRPRMEQFLNEPVAEVTQVPLLDACLYARLLVPKEMELSQFFNSLPFGETPPVGIWQDALETLKAIEVFDADLQVTPIGKQLTELPIDPRLAKMVLIAIGLKCLDPVVTIAASLASDDPFVIPMSPVERQKAFERKHNLVANNYSDHLTQLKAFQLWDKAGCDPNERKVFQDNYLSLGNLELISVLRIQLIAALRSAKYINSRGSAGLKNLNIHSESWPAVKAALTSAFYPNVARYSPATERITIAGEKQPCHFHFGSALLAEANANNKIYAEFDADNNPSSEEDNQSFLCKNTIGELIDPWIIFEQKYRTNQLCTVDGCTVITPLTALLFSKLSNFDICPLDENKFKNVVDSWNESDEDSDELPEQDVQNICDELNFPAEEMVRHNRRIRLQKQRSQPCKQFVIAKVDDFIGFIIDASTAQLVSSANKQFQDFLLESILEPGRCSSLNEESLVRCILSVLSSEEMALNLQQPSKIGSKPTNISNDLTSISSLNHNIGNIGWLKKCGSYTLPPKGYSYIHVKPSEAAAEKADHLDG